MSLDGDVGFGVAKDKGAVHFIGSVRLAVE